MKSSSGEHYIALDHVRALAAFIVFTWHFTHAATGTPIPFDYEPALFLLAILDEGHTGVALFMTLSGYLFAKLLTGKTISLPSFYWNRLLRLAPLLVVVFLIVGLIKWRAGEDLAAYGTTLLQGFIYPAWPNGGWSITTELHFYLALPLLLWLSARHPWAPLLLLLGAIGVRTGLYIERGEIQSLAYWTIIGRFDQFLLGMLAYTHRAHFAGRHGLALATALAFALFYWFFDLAGGFYQLPAYPSPSLVWLLLPTLEGSAYALLIAYYDNSYSPPRAGVSRLLGLLGTYSYSIYLLHFFVVFAMADFVHRHIMALDNFYVACAWSAIGFLSMMPLSYLSYRFIEAPFLALRKRYAR